MIGNSSNKNISDNKIIWTESIANFRALLKKKSPKHNMKFSLHFNYFRE